MSLVAPGMPAENEHNFYLIRGTQTGYYYRGFTAYSQKMRAYITGGRANDVAPDVDVREGGVLTESLGQFTHTSVHNVIVTHIQAASVRREGTDSEL